MSDAEVKDLNQISKKDISKTGILFQQYVMDQISQDEFCEKMEEMQKNQR